MQKTWTMADKTRCVVKPIKIVFHYVDLFELEDASDVPNEVNNLPKNWKSLDWHLLEQRPCLWGDDVVLALDAKKKIAYAIFDACTNAYRWTGTFEEFVMQNASDPETLDPFRVEGGK